jgi:hypothetical protein
MIELGPFLWIIDSLRGFQQSRRRVRVLVHHGFFTGGIGASSLATPPDLLASPPVTGIAGEAGVSGYYFVKVTNLSQGRDIEITHVWFAANPSVHLLMPERPLPARLRPDETWEGWVNAAALAHASEVERSGRVRLANGKTVRSRRNKDVPPIGYIAGQGTR